MLLMYLEHSRCPLHHWLGVFAQVDAGMTRRGGEQDLRVEAFQDRRRPGKFYAPVLYPRIP
jgi:hypothetical protein